jgi:hypothetical protein
MSDNCLPCRDSTLERGSSNAETAEIPTRSASQRLCINEVEKSKTDEGLDEDSLLNNDGRWSCGGRGGVFVGCSW